MNLLGKKYTITHKILYKIVEAQLYYARVGDRIPKDNKEARKSGLGFYNTNCSSLRNLALETVKAV